MTPRLWSVLTTVAVVVSGAAASPAAAAPPSVPAAPPTSTVAVAPPADGPQTTVTGELRRLVVADREGKRTVVSAVVTADGDAVQVRTTDLADVSSGATVTVSVAAAALDVTALDVDGGAPVSDVRVETVSAADGRVAEVPEAPAAREVHLMSALLPGQAPAVIDLAQVNAAVVDASDYFGTSTGGKVSLAVVSQRDAGTFAGWGAPGTCSSDQAFGLLDWAGEQAGIVPVYGSGKHVVVQTSSYTPCDELGMIMDIEDGGGIWINGATGADELDPWVVAQALGHTLGLGSSHARIDCEGLVDGPWYECEDAWLGSAYDVMGLVLPQTGDHLGTPGPLNAAQLEVLGLLDSTNAVWAIGPGTNTLQPVGGLTGVRFLRLAGVSDATYYVELRAAVGPDADLGTTRLGCVGGILDCTQAVFQPGVVIHRVDGDGATIGTDTFLVEAAAQYPRNDNDPPPFVLAPGRSIVVEDGEFEIGVAPSSPAGTATVTVKKGPGAAVHKPFGNFESVSATLGSVSLRGWAMDRDTRLSSYLWVSVGTKGRVARASAARADLARFFPEQGAFHGFDLKLDAAPGTHSVCVTVINTGPGANTALGCRAVTVPAGGPPIGVLDWVTAVQGGVTFAGWALDPDTLASSYVLVEAGGQATYALANQSRPDIARFFPAYGAAHGFAGTLKTAPGTQKVCATAVNYGSGTHTSLGCQTVTVPDASPFGQLEQADLSQGKFTFRGWAIDPDVEGPVTMWIDADGRGLRTVSADQSRPDVGAVFPQAGPNHGFSGAVSVPAGTRNICVWAINNARGVNVNFGCRPVAAWIG